VGDGVSGECVVQSDAGVDVPTDQGTAAFEVIYGDDWRIAVDAMNDGWLLLVATGANDPDLSTIVVKAVSDSHPTAIVRITAPPATGVVTHGHVGGKIFVDNTTLYNTAFTEQRDFPNQSLLILELLDAPAGDYMFDTHVELSVNGVSFALDFKIHHVDSMITYFAPEAVKRRTIYR